MVLGILRNIIGIRFQSLHMTCFRIVDQFSGVNF